MATTKYSSLGYRQDEYLVVGRSDFPLLTFEHQKLQETALEYLPIILLNSVSNLFLFPDLKGIYTNSFSID